MVPPPWLCTQHAHARRIDNTTGIDGRVGMTRVTRLPDTETSGILSLGLLHFVEVLLKLARVVGDEAECVVQGQVFEVGLVVLGLVTQFVQLR